VLVRPNIGDPGSTGAGSVGCWGGGCVAALGLGAGSKRIGLRGGGDGSPGMGTR
jgi:hypothetical protein